MAGFTHVALVEFESDYCKTLKLDWPEWNVICADVHDFDRKPYQGVDLLADGVPCPPFSIAGKQLGKDENGFFSYPEGSPGCVPTVGESLYDLMSENKWKGAKKWVQETNKIAPTLVKFFGFSTVLAADLPQVQTNP